MFFVSRPNEMFCAAKIFAIEEIFNPVNIFLIDCLFQTKREEANFL